MFFLGDFRFFMNFFILFAAKTLQEAGNVPYFPVFGPNKLLRIKIQLQIARFLTCSGLKLHVKGGLNNLIFSIGL